MQRAHQEPVKHTIDRWANHFTITTSTQVEDSDFQIQEEDPPVKEVAETILPEVFPQKDACYLPSTSESLSDDSNVSGSEDEDEEKLKPWTHKMTPNLLFSNRSSSSFSYDALTVVQLL